MTPRYRSRRARLAALSGQLRADGQSWAQIARSVQDQEHVNARVALRLAHGWTQEQVATRWNQQWPPKEGSAGITDKNISAWETWPQSGIQPSLKTLKRLAQLYQCDIGQLIEDADYRHLDEANHETHAVAPPPPSSAPIPPSGGMATPHGSQPAEQHSLGQGATGQDLPAQALTMIAEESFDFGERAGRSDVADGAIEQMAIQVQDLARAYVHEVPLPLLLEARKLRDRVARQLRGHARVVQERDLYALAAQVCGLLAWMTSDLGNHRAAGKHAWAAWICATQAGQDAGLAWVRATQAKLAYWDGRYSESAQFAADGLSYDCPGSGHTFLALLRARALACAGQPAAARQALDHAARERDNTSGSDLVGGLWSLTPGRYHALAASTYLQLAAPSQALAEASEAITYERGAAAPDHNYGAEMHARIDQALAHLQGRDLDGAASALQPVLNLAPSARYHTLAQHLATTRPLLAHASASRARELTEAINEYQPGRGVTPPPIAL